MCELPFNLVAWLDGELPPAEAATVARHLESCDTCRNCCAALRRTSETISLYTNAVFAANSRPKIPRWAPALAGAALVAAAVLFLILPRKSVKPLSPAVASVARSGTVSTAMPSPEPKFALRKPLHSKLAAPSFSRRPALWNPTDTAVEIAIPADAVFAPGALPEGIKLFAELSIAPDGSVREVRFRQ